MILKAITIENFGPFVRGYLKLSPEVTVLTGANDAGKSHALRAIQLLFSGQAMKANEVNRDRAKEITKSWQSDAGTLFGDGNTVWGQPQS